ncbi:uncharacterized protein LOC141838343 [Curcuma longa]|uniref:uncharacterized protein LOC141838343 n=1 Tax=Curcuma longa TaxID=136217 RepID=UPI003D9F192B
MEKRRNSPFISFFQFFNTAMDSQPRQQKPSRFWFPIWNQTPTPNPTQPKSPSSLVLESQSRSARTSRYALQSYQEASVPTISSPPTPSQGAAEEVHKKTMAYTMSVAIDHPSDQGQEEPDKFTELHNKTNNSEIPPAKETENDLGLNSKLAYVHTSIKVEIADEISSKDEAPEKVGEAIEKDQKKLDPELNELTENPTFSSNEAAQIEAKIGDGSDKDDTEEQGSNQIENQSVEQPHYAESQHAQNIINLAGENNGASMLIGHDSSKNAGHLETVHEIDKQSKNIHDEDETHGERSQVNNEVLSSTSINSNVQNINNSIIHDSSCRQEDPGVCLIFSGKPTTFKLKEKTD